MVKEEEIMAEAGGRGYMDMLGLGEESIADYFLCPSPSSSYLSSAAVSTTTNASTHAAAASPTCSPYLPPPAGPYHHILSFDGRVEQQYPSSDLFGAFQYYYGGGGVHAVPVAVPQKSSPSTECSSSISSMSSSPTATAVSAVSAPKPQPPKKKGSRSGDQRKAAAPAAAVPNKRPKVRKERLGERILALQQLVSPFGKTDTASVLHEALGYIRFLHDQVQVLSSPYMHCLPPSAPRAPEPPRAAPSDFRSRGLCLVPVACTDHVAGGGNDNGADVWSTVAAMGLPAVDQVQEEDKVAARRGDRHPGQLA